MQRFLLIDSMKRKERVLRAWIGQLGQMGLHGVLCSLAASLRSRGFQAVSATADVLCGLGCAAFGAARVRWGPSLLGPLQLKGSQMRYGRFAQELS
ncbi:hypothetical protein G5714_008761 [Onychostoma macrolepis]|uniref:Uncharacterized protein n=1 Tax=Onychostoma macrolepis TaxID=369639 RepID=A0A7J6CWV9_9TELE|nr:hypothetical protein G5714_008761 [Onychostoma macrolepis]